MKISLLSAFYPYRGGIAQFSAMLFRALEKEHEVQAFTFKKQYPGFLFPGSTQYVEEGDAADPIPANRTLDTTNPITFATTAKAIQQSSPDLVVSQYWMTYFGPAIGGVHKRLKGVKRISIIHNMIPHEKRFFDAPANRYFLKHNDGFVVMSDVVQRDLLSLKPEAKILRIDHPVYSQFGDSVNREEALSRLGLDPSKKYLLFFGFIRDYKGLDLLIEALSDLPEEHHLIIAGEVYGNFNKYQKMIDDRNLDGRIHQFLRYISDSEVPDFFCAADVCVLPYKSATQSGITAIAHHFNLPIIATDVGGLKENTHHGKDGLIVEKPHSHLIANAIKHFYNEALEATFRQNIAERKHASGWDEFARKLVAFSEAI